MRPAAVLSTLVALGAAGEARGEWRAAAYLGAATTRPSTVHIEQPALATSLRFQPVRFEGRSFEPALYYGYRLGYFFCERLGAEAEFIHLKAYGHVDRLVEVEGELRGAPLRARLPMNTIVGRFSISHGLNMLVANVVYTRRLSRPRWLSVAARAGAGPTIPHPESEIMGSGRQGYQLGRPALHLAGGAELRLWRGLHWLTEYKYTRTRQRVKVASGHAESLFRTHHAVFGLGVRF